MKQLTSLAKDLRRQGISLVLDFVFNHTSDEHDWALRFLSGECRMPGFYRMSPDRRMPDAYRSPLAGDLSG
jgi:amylosucrase